MSAVAALLLALIGTDRLGDPLPPGVTARYGTTRLCVERETLRTIRFHPTRDELYLVPNACLPVFGWALPSARVCFREPATKEPVTDLQFDQVGGRRLMLRAGAEIWNHASGRREWAVQIPHFGSRTNIVWGFSSDSVAVVTSPTGGVAPRGELRVLRNGERWSAASICRVPDGSAGALTADGDRLWIADNEQNEVRRYRATNGALTGWWPLPVEPDTDADSVIQRTPDGRRLIAIQTRQNHKADRFRGYPECFMQVFDTATNRVEARHAFRLDDVGGGGWLKPSEEGDGGYEFGAFRPSDDGQFLSWTDHSRSRRIRHLPTGRVVTLPGQYIGLERFAFSPNGKRLAVDDLDGIIRLIDPHTGRFQHTADSPPTAAKQAAVSPDGKLVATGHACGEVWVWDAVTGKPLWHTEPDGSEVREVHFNPTGTTVSAVGFWGPAGVRTFDAKTGKELGPMLPYRYYRTIAVSADGKRIADLIEEKSIQEKGGWAYPLFVRTREVATGKELARVRLDHRLGLPNETSGVISRDGRVMVVTHTNGATFAYDTATGRRLCEMQPSNGALAVSHDGRLALSFTNGKDGGHIWDTLTGSEIAVVDAPLLTQADVGFSPCGRFLVTRSSFGNLPVTWVFDIRSRQPTVFRGQTFALMFPDGKSVLTLPGIRGAERVSLEPLAWKVSPPPKPTEARLKELWKQLGEPAALEAVFELARHPAEAVPFLKAKLLTDPPDAKVVAGHIAKLGSKLFAERDATTKALRDLGPEVLPALRAALKADPSPEARSRIEKLLPVLADTAAPFTLARLRAVETLERCGTPDIRAVLKLLADTRPGTPWADDAARALVRLGR